MTALLIKQVQQYFLASIYGGKILKFNKNVNHFNTTSADNKIDNIKLMPTNTESELVQTVEDVVFG